MSFQTVKRLLLLISEIKRVQYRLFSIPQVSAGVACTKDHDTFRSETIYHFADQALYQAKDQGRN